MLSTCARTCCLLMSALGATHISAADAQTSFPASQAVTLWVTQLGESGAGSLRSAVERANARPGADRIRFARGLKGSVSVNGAPLLVSDALRIEGPGADIIRLRGDYEHRIIHVTARAGEVTLSGLQLSDAGDSAIFNEGAALVIENCVVRANYGARGAAIASYGGDLYVRDSIIRDNYAEMRGGGDDGVGGGIHAKGASVTIESSRVSSNHADALGGGIHADLPTDGVLLVRNSVIDANVAVTQGGGLFLRANEGAASGILNSTISGNHSPRHAAVWFNGGLVVNNSTVADNYSPMTEIPGVCAGLCGAGQYSQLWLASTLVSGNRDAHGNGYDLAPTSGGTHVSHSLIARVANEAIDDDRGGNRLNVDARIGPLGGPDDPLPVHALAPDSPAIDAGVNPSLFEYDQRGSGHPRVVGAAADIGAHEYAAPATAMHHARTPPFPLPDWQR